MAVMLIPAGHFYPAIEWWGWTDMLVLQLLILVYGCINIQSGYFMPVRCSADTNEQVVAITFDDGPHPTCTPAILDTLKKYNAPATFFCIGKNINGNEATLQRINAEDHLIGNHSYSHDFWFDMFGSNKMLANMQQMDVAVVTVINRKPVLFRPPYGVMNPNLRRAILKGKYTPIGWSVRSLDTAIKDKETLLSRIMSKLKAGDVILLHDSMEITAQLLPELIERIRNKGYKIIQLDKMLNITAYA